MKVHFPMWKMRSFKLWVSFMARKNRQFILERNDRNGACRYAPFLDQPSMLAHYTEPSSH